MDNDLYNFLVIGLCSVFLVVLGILVTNKPEKKTNQEHPQK